jgi:hypothetical protein
MVKDGDEFRLVGPDGKPMNVGLFIGPMQATSYAKRQGWEVVE